MKINWSSEQASSTWSLFDAYSDVSGDYYFRYRWYGAASGSFMGRDLLGYVDGMSVFAGWFAPQLLRDPFGSNSDLNYEWETGDLKWTPGYKNIVKQAVQLAFNRMMNTMSEITAERARLATLPGAGNCDCEPAPEWFESGQGHNPCYCLLQEHLKKLHAVFDDATDYIWSFNDTTEMYLVDLGPTTSATAVGNDYEDKPHDDELKININPAQSFFGRIQLKAAQERHLLNYPARRRNNERRALVLFHEITHFIGTNDSGAWFQDAETIEDLSIYNLTDMPYYQQLLRRATRCTQGDYRSLQAGIDGDKRKRYKTAVAD